MARLPVPGSDSDSWGGLLNDFLAVAHNADGTLIDGAAISGAQQRAVLTARGDLYVATGSGTTTRLAAGSDGQVLTADSAQPTGIKWAAADGSSSDSAAMALGLIAQTFQPSHGTNAFGLNAGTLVLNLVHLPAGAVTTLGIGVRGAGVTPTGVNMLALYRLTAPTAVALIAQTIDMTPAFSGAVAGSWISGALSGGPQTVTAGQYYVAALTHFTTPPSIVTGPDSGPGFGGNIPVINGMYPSLFLNSQASLPATVDLTAMALNSVYYYMTIS